LIFLQKILLILKKLFVPAISVFILLIHSVLVQAKPVRVRMITGGHGYQEKEFNEMLTSLGKNITCEVVSFPAAFDRFRTENWEKYDVLVFSRMVSGSTMLQTSIPARAFFSGAYSMVASFAPCDKKIPFTGIRRSAII
jgi:hypothetical protein